MSYTLHDPLFSRKCQTKLTIITNITNIAYYFVLCTQTFHHPKLNLLVEVPLTAIAHFTIQIIPLHCFLQLGRI